MLTGSGRAGWALAGALSATGAQNGGDGAGVVSSLLAGSGRAGRAPACALSAEEESNASSYTGVQHIQPAVVVAPVVGQVFVVMVSDLPYQLSLSLS